MGGNGIVYDYLLRNWDSAIVELNDYCQGQ